MPGSPIPAVAAARSSLAGLSKNRPADDPSVIEARRRLAAENIAAYVAKVVHEAPPLTQEQAARLSLLLRASAA